MAGSDPIDVSIVIPMYNAASTIREALSSLLSQEDVRPKEILVVDDGSTDASARIVEEMALTHPQVRLIRQEHRGAARTVNHGIQEATGSIIGLLDSDAKVERMWLANLVKAFENPTVFAAAGKIEIANPRSIWARIAGCELLYRYSKFRGPFVNHLSTCNILYRREVFSSVGFFNPDLAIGYDVDMSYRIGRLGKRIYYSPDAVCYNFWREEMYAYFRQQYRYAHDRAELIWAHRDRALGDDVTGPRMLVQVPMTLALLGTTALAFYQTVTAGSLTWRLAPALVLLGLIAERIHEAVATYRVTKDRIALLLPPVHVARNIVWVAAVVGWCGRRLGQWFVRRVRRESTTEPSNV